MAGSRPTATPPFEILPKTIAHILNRNGVVVAVIPFVESRPVNFDLAWHPFTALRDKRQRFHSAISTKINLQSQFERCVSLLAVGCGSFRTWRRGRRDRCKWRIITRLALRNDFRLGFLCQLARDLLGFGLFFRQPLCFCFSHPRLL